jgi:hypothetical protein
MTSQLDSLILGFGWANLRRSLSYMPVSRSALLFIHLFKIVYCESLEFVDLKKMELLQRIYNRFLQHKF